MGSWFHLSLFIKYQLFLPDELRFPVPFLSLEQTVQELTVVLALLVWCYPPESTDHGYPSLPFSSSFLNSKCQPRLCLNRSQGPRVKAVLGGEKQLLHHGWQLLQALGHLHIFLEKEELRTGGLGGRGKEAGSVAWASDTLS